MNTLRVRIVRGAAVVGFLSLGLASGSARAEPAAAAPAARSGAAPAAPSLSTEPGASGSPGSAAPSTTPGSAAPTDGSAHAAVHHTAWPWIVLGTGVALVATAGVLEILAVHQDDQRQSDEEKLTATNDPVAKQMLQDSASSHDDSAKHGRTAATILGTVGFLAVAGAVVWWFAEGGFGPPAEPPPTQLPAAGKRNPTLLPAPILTPGFAGASLVGTF